MDPHTEHDAAAKLMRDFLERTGVLGHRDQVRYLWTDAFAVHNLVALASATAEPEWLRLARVLVDRVHHTLGRHRPDERARSGWISGASEAEGEAHPTRGGLRIGKRLPERAPGAPPDEQQEWDQDGQYFHYLVRWMHALDQLARATGEARLNLWARELAAAAFSGFALPGPANPSRLAWKMSIDLSRPLVSSMGQHDALDGVVTFALLRWSATELGVAGQGPDLAKEERALIRISEGLTWTTADPLGLGGLLADAAWTAQLSALGALDGALLPRLLAATLPGLGRVASLLGGDTSGRLAFRELGLAIGLEAPPVVAPALEAHPERFPRLEESSLLLREVEEHHSLGPTIRSVWLDSRNQRSPAWREHLDINAVMLAASLLPDGVLVLRRPPPRPGAAP